MKLIPYETKLPDRYAGLLIARARRDGFIDSPKNHKCVDCGSMATVWEHRDYNKPYSVEPTCQSCNVKRGSAKCDHKKMCDQFGDDYVKFVVRRTSTSRAAELFAYWRSL